MNIVSRFIRAALSVDRPGAKTAEQLLQDPAFIKDLATLYAMAELDKKEVFDEQAQKVGQAMGINSRPALAGSYPQPHPIRDAGQHIDRSGGRASPT